VQQYTSTGAHRNIWEYMSIRVKAYRSMKVQVSRCTLFKACCPPLSPASLARHGCRMARHAARGHVQGSIFVPLSIVLFRANSREDIKSISDGLA